jgi:hypothetical protein
VHNASSASQAPSSQEEVTIKYNGNTHILVLGISYITITRRLWNSLPIEIRTDPSLYTFRPRLKTHLFAKAYPP